MAIAKKPVAPRPKTSPRKKPSAKAKPRQRIELTGKQRSYLRALAHDLKPVVQIGVAGVSDGVIKQIDEALETHELVKVKLAKEAPVDTVSASEPLEQRLMANVAQRIGRTLVLYRPRREEPSIRLPR
ncbi:MAG: ribosome assembly RNA-binding protein YhbY [Polyangiaceae bacterium]